GCAPSPATDSPAISGRCCRSLPRIQHGWLDVIEPDGEPFGGHPHPGKAMRRLPKALLRVGTPQRGQLHPACPFDDLLIPAEVQVGLIMVVPGKVHMHGARTDQMFEGAAHKPRSPMALSPGGAGGIMAKQEAPPRLTTERGLRGGQLEDPD